MEYGGRWSSHENYERIWFDWVIDRQSIDQKGQTSNRKTISKPDRSDLVTIGVKLVFYSTTGNKAPVNADLFVESSNLRKRPGTGQVRVLRGKISGFRLTLECVRTFLSDVRRVGSFSFFLGGGGR